VLGNLPGGDYQLSTYGPSPFAGGTRLLWTQPFSVPSDSGPTLIATLDGEAVRIDVRGVPAAHYVIEASATLQDWRPVYSAQGAPFAWTTNRTSAPSNSIAWLCHPAGGDRTIRTSPAILRVVGLAQDEEGIGHRILALARTVHDLACNP
jgi:hypothetical protein